MNAHLETMLWLWFSFFKVCIMPLIIICIIQYIICRRKSKYSKIISIVSTLYALQLVAKYLFHATTGSLELSMILNALFIPLSITSLFIFLPLALEKIVCKNK